MRGRRSCVLDLSPIVPGSCTGKDIPGSEVGVSFSRRGLHVSRPIFDTMVVQHVKLEMIDVIEAAEYAKP